MGKAVAGADYGMKLIHPIRKFKDYLILIRWVYETRRD